MLQVKRKKAQSISAQNKTLTYYLVVGIENLKRR